MQTAKKFEAEIYVRNKEEGGRHTPFFSNYKPQFFIRTADVTGQVSTMGWGDGVGGGGVGWGGGLGGEGIEGWRDGVCDRSRRVAKTKETDGMPCIDRALHCARPCNKVGRASFNARPINNRGKSN